MDVAEHGSDNEIAQEEVYAAEKTQNSPDSFTITGDGGLETKLVDANDEDARGYESTEESVKTPEEHIEEGGCEAEQVQDENDIAFGGQEVYQDGVEETVEHQESKAESDLDNGFAPNELGDENVYEAHEEVTVDQEQYAEQQEVTEEQEFDGQDEATKEEDFSNHSDLAEHEEVAEEQEVRVQEDIGGESADLEPNAEKQDAKEDSRDSNEHEDDDPPVTKNDDSEEEDFDNVVEVEEHKAESDEEGENVAQHVSDSENEDGAKAEEIKLGDVSEDDLRGASSGSENEASEDDNNVSPTKKRNAILSSDDEEKGGTKEMKDDLDKHDAVLKMFDSEDEQKEDGVGDLIADIFGESDDEEEFTGFGQEEILDKKTVKAKTYGISDDSEDEEPPLEDHKESDEEQFVAKKSSKKQKASSKDDSDSDEGVRDSRNEAMSDFDLMLQRKKEESRKRRNRKDGGTFISDADDIINAMLTKMKEAAEADREANLKRKPALKKLKMLPTVITHLKKQDLKEAFVDNGVIAAIADWLSLLPDRSLPHITIRTELLKVLHDLPPVSAGTLKQSGIGKSVMILFKHPRESRTNKDSAGRLINKWSRPIFGLNENFKSMSREEREQRDLEQMPQAKRRRLSSGAARGQSEEGRADGELGHLRPGEQGFVMRARVPVPSTKDYVVRPKWNVQMGGGMDDDDEPAQVQKRRRSAGAPRSSKKDERLEKHMRNFAERKKNSKLQRAVKISIEGNKMSIV